MNSTNDRHLRSLEHLSLVVWSVLVLDFLGHRLDFVDGVRDTDQISPGYSIQRVTSGTDLSVDYVGSAICL